MIAERNEILVLKYRTIDTGEDPVGRFTVLGPAGLSTEEKIKKKEEEVTAANERKEGRVVTNMRVEAISLQELEEASKPI